MKLKLPDLAILVAYLVTMVVLGWSLRKKASLNKENYLLGGKSLP
jgi:Na+/proline symporter